MPAGRPKKKIDYDLVYSLAEIFCTQEEIASVVKISARTLQKDKEFLRVYKEGKDGAKISLRRKQLKLSDKSAAMAIWLGKQYLGQKEPDNTYDDGTPKTADFKFTVISNAG